MRPTPEDMLDGAERSLRTILQEGELPPGAAAAMTDVVRMVSQARRAVADRPTFLAADNDRLRALLTDLIHELPTASPAREQVRAYLSARAAVTPA